LKNLNFVVAVPRQSAADIRKPDRGSRQSGSERGIYTASTSILQNAW